MARKWLFICSVLFGLVVSDSQSSKENNNTNKTYIEDTADVIISDSKAQKSVEVKNPINSTSPQTSTFIQQGNNVFIKPKFIIGSPFTSYKEGYDEDIFLKAKGPITKPTIVIERVPQPPSVLQIPLTPPSAIPPLIIPTKIPLIPNEVKVPILPPFVPPLLKDPVLVQKPIDPTKIPKPPQLPPLILPKLPIQVIVQRLPETPQIPPPIFPVPIQIMIPRPTIPIPKQPVIIPNYPMVVSPLCPQKRSGPNNIESPLSSIFRHMYRKFKNMLKNENTSMRKGTTNSVVEEYYNWENVTTNLRAVYPTLCVQEIVAERVVKNIISTEEKVYWNPISLPVDGF